jgi:hypothetical protein
MTEWADTEMKVYGSREDLKKFKNDVAEDGAKEEENSVFSFNKIIPMPEDLSPWAEEGYSDGSVAWQSEHWGVKWGERYTFVDDKWDYLQYVFDNPWGAPCPIFNALIEQYPKLTFDIVTHDYNYEIDLRLHSHKNKITEFYCSKGKEDFDPREIGCVFKSFSQSIEFQIIFDLDIIELGPETDELDRLGLKSIELAANQ